MCLHSIWQRFWAHGFVQCPFATNNAHELIFAAEETAMTAKTVMRRWALNNWERNVTNCSASHAERRICVLAFPFLNDRSFLFDRSLSASWGAGWTCDRRWTMCSRAHAFSVYDDGHASVGAAVAFPTPEPVSRLGRHSGGASEPGGRVPPAKHKPRYLLAELS